MPLPTELQKFIAGSGLNFDPSISHDFYHKYRETWQTYLDLFELDATKLAGMLVPHSGNEDKKKLELREKLAAVFNFIPAIVNMVKGYVFAEDPIIDDAKDADLIEFLADCDGAGLSFVEWVRGTGLPLALVMGMVDVMVQNPPTDGGDLSAAEAEELKPKLYAITPLQRNNWSVRSDHSYNWVSWEDSQLESTNPFYRGALIPLEVYYTVSAGLEYIGDGENKGKAFWVRSLRGGGPYSPAAAGMNAILGPNGKPFIPSANYATWQHDGGFLPMKCVPISTLYYQKSMDHKKRHFGISKIAMIAILTRKIIQLLSWTDEDVLANLALFVMPGKRPVGTDGKPLPFEIQPFSVYWTGTEANVSPSVIQGSVSHIEMKMKIVDVYMREILRLAFLLGVSGSDPQSSASTPQSGFAAVVNRNELFQELTDIAGALDDFTIDTLAHVKSWATGEEWTRKDLREQLPKLRVDFFKGPYSVDPLAVVIANSQALISIFEEVSPEMVKSVYKNLANTALYNEDQSRQIVQDEIDEHLDDVLANRMEEKKAANEAIANAMASGNNPPGEDVPPGNNPPAPAAVKKPPGDGQDANKAGRKNA